MIEPFKEPVRKMLELLELSHGLYRFALAFLRDTLDPKRFVYSSQCPTSPNPN